MFRLLAGALVLFCTASLAEEGTFPEEAAIPYECSFRRLEKGAVVEEKKATMTASSGSCAMLDELVVAGNLATAQACLTPEKTELELFIYNEDQSRPKASNAVGDMAKHTSLTLESGATTKFVMDCKRP